MEGRVLGVRVAAVGRLLLELALTREFFPDYSGAAPVELSRFLQVLLQFVRSHERDC